MLRRLSIDIFKERILPNVIKRNADKLNKLPAKVQIREHSPLGEVSLYG